MTDPASVQQRLAAIDEDLASRQPRFEQVSGDLIRVKRDIDLRLAQCLVVAQGGSEKIREAQALLALVAADPALYEKYKELEAEHGALKAAMSTLTARATIGQSLLRSLTQEQNRSNREPQWTPVP